MAKSVNFKKKYLKYKSKYLNLKAGARKTKFDPYKCLCDSIADKYIQLFLLEVFVLFLLLLLLN